MNDPAASCRVSKTWGFKEMMIAKEAAMAKRLA
jgi:hypothetical protein